MPKIVKAGIIDIIGLEDPNGVLRRIEHCGRVAYMTWDKENELSSEKFVRMLIRLGHESVLEHSSVTVLLQCDRSTAQQLTRHRIASFTMQSQRYCNYSADRFGGEVTFVDPEMRCDDVAKLESANLMWRSQVEASERAYFDLLGLGIAPEDARSVLPNSTACVLAITANLREWRHIFKLRTECHAQHNIRDLMASVLDAMFKLVPCVFSDIIASTE